MTTPVLACTDTTCNLANYATLIQLETLTVANQFNSVISTELDNVNIISTITIANLSPGAGQVIGTDNLNQLGWQEFPLGVSTPSALYSAVHPQNFNSAASSYIDFVDPGVYNNAGITYDGTDTFTLPVDNVYEIDFRGMVTASASTITFSIEFDGVVERDLLMGPTSNNGSCTQIISTVAGANTVRILCTRIGVDATAKNNYSANATEIKFTRIA